MKIITLGHLHATHSILFSEASIPLRIYFNLMFLLYQCIFMTLCSFLGSRPACYCSERGEGRSYTGRNCLGTRSDRSSYTRTCKSCCCGQRFTKITSTLSQDRKFRRFTSKGLSTHQACTIRIPY